MVPKILRLVWMKTHISSRSKAPVLKKWPMLITKDPVHCNKTEECDVYDKTRTTHQRDTLHSGKSRRAWWLQQVPLTLPFPVGTTEHRLLPWIPRPLQDQPRCVFVNVPPAQEARLSYMVVGSVAPVRPYNQYARKEGSIFQCQCWTNCLKCKLTWSRARSFHYSVLCTWSSAKSFHHSVLRSIRANRYSSTQLTEQEEK